MTNPSTAQISVPPDSVNGDNYTSAKPIPQNSTLSNQNNTEQNNECSPRKAPENDRKAPANEATKPESLQQAKHPDSIKKPVNPIVERLTNLMKSSHETRNELTMQGCTVTLPYKKHVFAIRVRKHVIRKGEGLPASTVGSTGSILYQSFLTDVTRSFRGHEKNQYQTQKVRIGTGSDFPKALEAFASTMCKGEQAYFECPAQDVLGHQQNLLLKPGVPLSEEHIFCAVVEMTNLNRVRSPPKDADELLSYVKEDFAALDTKFKNLKQNNTGNVKKILTPLRNILQKGMQWDGELTTEQKREFSSLRQRVCERIVFCLWHRKEYEKAAVFIKTELIDSAVRTVRIYQFLIQSYVQAGHHDSAQHFLDEALKLHGNDEQLTKLNKKLARMRLKQEGHKGISFMPNQKEKSRTKTDK